MSRPQHLGCINTVEGIRRINEEQRAYDDDSERYERQQEAQREYYELEQQEMRQQEQLAYEREQERMQDDSLPF